MLQLTDGIACAHNSYIIHRDIKPQNIIVLDDGRVKITDFGIAQALNRHELTETNSVMGSVHYLPPEQANGTGTTIKSDIYSLGIVMFELLTGKVPFKGENAVEIAIKQMKDPIPSVRDYKEEIPQSIENIILKATAKNPKNRYDSVLEMQEDIKNALKEEKRDEKRLEFLYPEFEKEETELPSRAKKNAQKEEDFLEEEKNKKSNKRLWIVGIVIAIVALITLFVIFILPSFKKVPDVTIPDVSNKTVAEAVKELEKIGLVVEAKTNEQYSDKVEEGKIIKTNPQIGMKVKEGTSVTITISLGLEGFLSENYVGKNYIEVKTMLETKGIEVVLEEQEYTEKDEIKEDTVLKQDIEAGIELKKGDKVTLTIPKLIKTYPDFTDGTWTLEKIENFCKENNITLKQKTIKSNEYPKGTILAQDRAFESKVVAGVTLTITISEVVEEALPDEKLEGVEPVQGAEDTTNQES